MKLKFMKKENDPNSNSLPLKVMEELKKIKDDILEIGGNGRIVLYFQNYHLIKKEKIRVEKIRK